MPVIIALSLWLSLMGPLKCEKPQQSPTSHYFVLDNGLKVVVLRHHRSPVIGHFLFYGKGSADDPYQKTGLAHYVEHMMFKGPKGSPSRDINKIIEGIGGRQNAVTTYDYTMYYNIVPATHIEKVMALEAGRMKHLTVRESDAKPELNVIFEERRMRFENNPMGEFFTLLLSHFYQYHPYRNPPIGWEGDLAHLTAKDVQTFYNEAYTPDNACLILVGDITFEKAKELIDTYYKPIEKKSVMPFKRCQEPKRSKTSKTLTLASSFVRHPLWVKAYPLSTLPTNLVKRTALLSLIRHILTVDPWGLLYKTLVSDEKIATDIGIEFINPARDENIVFFVAEPAPHVNLKTLEDKMNFYLEKICHKGITQEDLDRAKHQLKIYRAYEEDNAMGPSTFFGEHMIMGASFEDIEKRYDFLDELTLEEVNTTLKSLRNETYHLTGYLLPDDKKNNDKNEGRS